MTKFSEIAHHYLGTGLQATYTDTFGETVVGTLDGVDTRYQRVHIDGCITYDCKPHFRSLHKLTQPIRVEGGEPFVPMQRLKDLMETLSFEHIDRDKYLSQQTTLEIKSLEAKEGGTYWIKYSHPFGDQSGYAINYFEYSSQFNRFGKIQMSPDRKVCGFGNQLELFQQLLSWHFNLWNLPEGEFIEIEETTNTPEAGEK